MEDLESHLKAARKDGKGGILVITEGVFGMKGNLAKLPEIVELKDRYGARLFVDDAHGFGVMGTWTAAARESTSASRMESTCTSAPLPRRSRPSAG